MSFSEMLYQKARPSSIDGYVFVDKSMETYIKKGLKDKEFPNMILVGGPGVGKCLDGSEPVDLRIKGQDGTYKHWCLPIKEYFELVNADNIEYETPVVTEKSTYILGPHGNFLPVRGLVKKYHTRSTYYLENGISISCSDKHIIFQNKKPTLISNAKYVDTVSGTYEIVDVVDLGEGEVYDVSLDDPHQYVTPNGIIHHNTTLAYILCNECDIDSSDILYIKSSLTNGIDEVRDRIEPFVNAISVSSSGRVVIIDEVDGTSKAFQDSLRNIIEDSMTNARFILTANYSHKIRDTLYSRCNSFVIDSLDKDQYTYRVADVISKEGIKFDLETLEYYVNKNYPDMRKIYNDIEKYTTDNKLTIVNSDAEIEKPDWLLEAIELFKTQQFRKGRDAICSNISYEEFDEIYRLIYENIEWWTGNDDDKKDRALMVIKDHVVADTSVGDREIVLSSCLTRLSLL